MNARIIYEKVNLVVPLEQRRFFNYLNDTVSELLASYDKFVLADGAEFEPIMSIDNDLAVRPLFMQAIVDNILFYASGNEAYKSEFVRKAQEAYLKYWNDNAKGRVWGGRTVTW